MDKRFELSVRDIKIEKGPVIPTKFILKYFLHEEGKETRIVTLEQITELLNKQGAEIQNLKMLVGLCESENSILHNELGVALEQGYTLSEAYMDYKEMVRSGIKEEKEEIIRLNGV